MANYSVLERSGLVPPPPCMGWHCLYLSATTLDSKNLSNHGSLFLNMVRSASPGGETTSPSVVQLNHSGCCWAQGVGAQEGALHGTRPPAAALVITSFSSREVSS